MNHRRVVVTGIGVISALGENASEFWSALSQGRSGIRPMQGVDRTQFRFQNGAEVRNYNPSKYFEEKDHRCWTGSRNSRWWRRAKPCATRASNSRRN